MNRTPQLTVHKGTDWLTDESLKWVEPLALTVSITKHTFDTPDECVTIHETDRPGGTKYSAWFGDGSESLHLSTLWENQATLPAWVRESMSESLRGEDLSLVKTVVAYLADSGQMVCGNCGCLFDRTDRHSRGFAGTICHGCYSDAKACPESGDGEHKDRCLNPSQKSNARIPTRYKCEECGRTRSTTPTG